MSFVALGRLQNHKVPHLHPNSTMFMPLDRLQLKINAFSGKFNVCFKRVLLSWIKICRDFKLQTQIFTQKYRSWLRFYSEFLRKKLAAEGSGQHAGGQHPQGSKEKRSRLAYPCCCQETPKQQGGCSIKFAFNRWKTIVSLAETADTAKRSFHLT